MKCRKCKATLKKKTKFCPVCGAKVKRVGRRVIAAILVLVIIAGGAGVAGWKLGLLPFQNADISSEGFTLLTGSFTDRKITDQESALASIGDVADILEIEDVNAEFSECKVDTVSGNTYYRFYQKYKGIPVYGRSVIVAADGDGDSLSLSGNYLSIDNIEIIPQLDEDTALKSIEQNYGMDMDIGNAELVIYSLESRSPILAWKVYVNSDEETGCCFLSAIDGSIVSYNSLVFPASGIGSGVDIDNKKQSFSTKKEGTLYTMVDEDRNINVYNANYTTLIKDFTSNDGAYSLSLKIQSENQPETELFPVSNAALNNNWDDAKAVTAMARVGKVYDFYYDTFARLRFNDKNGLMHVVYNDYMDGDVINAYSSGGDTKQITLLSFGIENSMANDVIAHEYTHSVEQAISTMIYSGESGAIMEAYSDIFGELFEDWQDDYEFNGTCDWIHNRYGAYKRSLSKPMETKYPDYYQGDNWVDTADEENDHGGVHTNSTVISHAAYYMHNGISGNNPYFEALTTEDIAQLFYRTLYTLPSDCTFSQLRSLIQNTAEIMYQQGFPGFSYEKVRWVSNAFFQVGIEPAVTPVSKEELSLDVYDIHGQPYNNYTLYVRYYSGAEKKYAGETVAAEGISFPLTGRYELTIEDNANTDNRTTITVQAVDTIKYTKLPVYTQCGLSKIDGPIIAPPSGNTTPLDAYMEAANRTTATGSWTEDMDMTASMILEDGSSSVKTKATMEASVDVEGWNGTDTSSLYMSGSASMSVLNQEIAYTMTWKNGIAHYVYTKPTVTTDDLEIDPSYFNFNSLTDDMIVSSAINGNQISFIVRGDDLTQAGIAVVNDLLPGVGNLSYDDATVNVIVNEQSGKIDTLTMIFHASMTYQGYDAEADYVMVYCFSAREDLENNRSDWEKGDSNETSDMPIWLDELPVMDSDRYTGNQGDSFISKIGTRNGARDTGGNDYAHGLEAWIARWNYQNESSWAWCTYDLGGRYDILTGTIGILDGSYNKTDFDTTLEIWGDGKLLYALNLLPDMENAVINLPIEGVKILKISLYDNRSVSGGTSFALGNFQLHGLAKANEEPGLLDLTDGYWENNIQSRHVYRFLGDGTVQEYDIEPTAPITEENLHASHTLRYSFNGKRLVLEGDGFQTTLELVTTNSPIVWDSGLRDQLADIPDDVVFFYETAWTRDEFSFDNAMYLVKAEQSTDVPLYSESYQTILGQYSETSYPAQYTLYDIDQNGIPELFVHYDGNSYDIYSFRGTEAVFCGKLDAYDNGLYEYDGNGVIVHDGGMGSLHVEYISLYTLTDDGIEYADAIKSTEECSYEELRNSLKAYKSINDFYPISDISYIHERLLLPV